MASEELRQRGFLKSGSLKGESFGKYEEINIGATSLDALVKAGLEGTLPKSIVFPFREYKAPKKPSSAKPDRLICFRNAGQLTTIAVIEHKSKLKFRSAKDKLYAAEEALYSALALGAKIGVATDGEEFKYFLTEFCLQQKKIEFLPEIRSLNPAVIDDLLAGGSIERDPAQLSERVWQHIWHATKEEPKQCLLTFVELFVLKFLSDNLSTKLLPESQRFYELLLDNKRFIDKHGKSQIEYYIEIIRPQIKKLFQDNTICDDPIVPETFGLSTIVSKTSIINGFSFLRSSVASPATYNRVFLDILEEFHKFGSLSIIEPEFKLRLYETFLKKSARQAKLGQFFTPRNIVKAIIKMARIDKLPKGSICLDPAAGVGGFVLEPLLLNEHLRNNISFQAGKVNQEVRFIGVDVDASTHILAKANLLIHLVENVRDPSVTVEALNKLMARMFVLMNEDETLGSLAHPPLDAVDLVMTNPPYVTQGSRIYKEAISEGRILKDGTTLREYYTGCGLGLESLFLRYISGALKPGARAFVIVPQGLLTRTEEGTKGALLSECNLLASIALPRNTFFNTPQKTYILALEKRRTHNQSRPVVFCAIARSIGETLDYRRLPTPDDNDLQQIAEMFLSRLEGKQISASILIKEAPASSFQSTDRWDVLRFWSDEELVKLGEREPALDRVNFIDEVEEQLEQISAELESTRNEIKKLTAGTSKKVSIGNNKLFKIRRGTRVRRGDCDLNPGLIPVYSGSKDPNRPLGNVSEEWLKQNAVTIENKPIITVNANGYVGAVFVRHEKCVIHDDVMIVELKREDIDIDYVAYQLEGSIAEGNYEYEAKLYSRVGELEIAIPTKSNQDDTFDLDRQKQIASAIKQFKTVVQKLRELGNWSSEARFKNDNDGNGSKQPRLDQSSDKITKKSAKKKPAPKKSSN